MKGERECKVLTVPHLTSFSFPFILELEGRIEHLREIKRRYLQVLGLSRAFTSHFYNVIQTQVGFIITRTLFMLGSYFLEILFSASPCRSIF